MKTLLHFPNDTIFNMKIILNTRLFHTKECLGRSVEVTYLAQFKAIHGSNKN